MDGGVAYRSSDGGQAIPQVTVSHRVAHQKMEANGVAPSDVHHIMSVLVFPITKTLHTTMSHELTHTLHSARFSSSML